MHNVSGEYVGGSSGEGREYSRRELIDGHIVFGFLIANRFPLLGQTTVYGTLVLVLVQEGQQLGHIDEHVVVRLENVLCLRAMHICPFQRRYCLEREVVVRVYEVSPYQISIDEVLLGKRFVYGFIGATS